MKLRTSYFNSTVLKKDTTRFAPLWGLYSVFTLMVVFLLWSNDISPARFANNASDIMRSMGIVNFVYAGLCAILLFGDLFAPRLCNALHAMPLRREGWFLTHCAAGFLFCIVPNTVAALICALLLRQYFWMAFVWLGLMVLQFLFFFGVGALAAVSAGNRLGAIAIYGIINLLAVIAAWLVITFYEPFLYGIELEAEAYTWLSPIVQFSGSDFVNTSYDKIEGLIWKGFVADQWRYAYIAAAVGAVFLLLAVLVYRKRKLENAGDFISLQPVGPVFLIIYTLCVGAAMYFISDVTAEGSRYVFLILGLAIGFFTGKMLLERKVNVFKGKTFLHFGIFLALFAASVGLTWLDPVGTTRYVPDVQQITSVSISPYASYHYRQNFSLELTETEDITTVTDLHKDLLTDRTTNKNTALYIRYELKNGTQVNRKYYVEPQSENGQLLRAFYNRQNFLLGGYDLDTLLHNAYLLEFHSYRDGDLPNLAVSTSPLFMDLNNFKEKYGEELTLAYYTNQLAGSEDPVGLDVALVRGLFEAIEKDCQAGNMVQLWEYHPNQDTYGSLVVEYYIPESSEHVAQSLDITVFEDCKHTIAYLESLE